MTKALLILSGGQDSTTCGFWAKQNGFDEIHAVTFDYNQLHSAEIDSSKKIAELLDVASHEIIKMGPILAGTSPLVNNDEKLEQYADYGVLPGGLEKTFVPARNLLFLTVAANRAYVKGVNNLITGVCQEDFGGYPDCRQTFINAVESALNEGMFTGEDGAPNACKIITPLMNLTKAQSVLLATSLPGCYAALAHSHTSYDGQYPPTGKDHATLLRAKGFAEANTPDPLILRAVAEGKMKMPTVTPYDQDLATWKEKAGF